MNIGIIIHSQTGNTNSVALKLQEKLTAAGNTVTLEALEVGAVRPGIKNIEFGTLPDVEQFDAIVFGAPVMGFSLSPAMKYYLEKDIAINGKKVAFLVTQFFPHPALGGNRAVREMKLLCEAKGALCIGSEIINWSRPGREQKINECTDRLSNLSF